jgi:sporulation protein YlmC with PRC-barrel domain
MKRIWNSRNIGMAALCCGLGLMMTDLSVAQQPATQPQQQQLQQRQQQLQQQAGQQAQRQSGQKEFCMASDLIGMHVKAKGEEKIGEVKNLLINEDGQVQYLAVKASDDRTAATDRDESQTPRAQILQQDREQQQPGQRIGQDRASADSGKLTLVPWQSVKLHNAESKDQSYVAIDIEKDRLMSAPSFTEQQLTSQQTQAQLASQVDQFFNVRSQRGAARPQLDADRQQQDRRDDN